MRQKVKVLLAASLAGCVAVGGYFALPMVREQILLRGVQQGDAGAAIKLAKIYQSEILSFCGDLPRSRQILARSRELLRTQADAGNADAMYELALTYRTGICEVVPIGVRELSLSWAMKAAQKGHLPAMGLVAQAYLDVTGDEAAVSEARANAVAWYMRMAEAGNPGAQAWIGYRYLQGLYLPQDYEKARVWLEKALANGYTGARRDVGLLNVNKLVEFPNRRRGLEMIIEAAEQGDHGAQMDLASIYTEGEVTPKNFVEARRWAKEASSEHVQAQMLLASMYLEGNGGSKDFVEAYAWTSVARAGISTKYPSIRREIETQLRTIDAQLSPADRLEGEDKAKRYAASVHTLF
jgi:TPR repeat protein